MVAQNYEMDFTETNISIYQESQNQNQDQEMDKEMDKEDEGAQVECWKCEGTKLNKRGKKPCRKCQGTGSI